MAISRVRSRTAMAIVLAETRRMVNVTAAQHVYEVTGRLRSIAAQR